MTFREIIGSLPDAHACPALESVEFWQRFTCEMKTGKQIAKTTKVVPFGLNLPGKFTRTSWQLPKDLTLEQWVLAMKHLAMYEGAMQWWLGDGWAYSEDRKWGEGEEFAEKIGVDYKTIRNYASICRAIELSRRRDNLTFTHHAEIAGQPAREQDRLLAKAEREDLSAAKLRRLASDLKRGTTRRQLQFEAEKAALANVVYADPAWQYSNTGLAWAAEEHYPTMSTDEICAMKVRDAVAENAVLFLWATSPMLPDALRVMEAWGFEYKTQFVWVKDKPVVGFYVHSRHELLLIGVRGSFLPETTELPESVIDAPTAEHSRKPECVYDLIERMYPSSIKTARELFCRGPGRRGWMKPWGNEAK
jgi:N6-adenosine-specific RNA methylase IME4